jgi:hypothetical protein
MSRDRKGWEEGKTGEGGSDSGNGAAEERRGVTRTSQSQPARPGPVYSHALRRAATPESGRSAGPGRRTGLDRPGRIPARVMNPPASRSNANLRRFLPPAGQPGNLFRCPANLFLAAADWTACDNGA